MARICPQCGTRSMMGTTQCPKCGNSLTGVIETEISALREMRIYSIIVLIFAVFGTISYVLNFVNTGSFTTGGLLTLFGAGATGVTGVTASNITTLFIILEVVLILGILFQIISYIYLRACFSKLGKQDYEFSTPRTGATLLIVGLVLAMVGISVILALIIPVILSSQTGNLLNNPGLIIALGLAAVLTIIGGLLTFIGYIIGVLLGIHKLATKFEESLFDYGWILLIISLFFAPLALVSGILFLQGTKMSVSRLRNLNTAGNLQ